MIIIFTLVLLALVITSLDALHAVDAAPGGSEREPGTGAEIPPKKSPPEK